MNDRTGSILLDTSVWIDAFQGKTHEIVRVTKDLLNDDRVLTCGPVIFEIKKGLRPSERKKILHLFDALIRLSVNEEVWDAAGDLDATLRRKGVTIPPMAAIIAQICIHHHVSLFTRDEHFFSVPGLKLYRP